MPSILQPDMIMLMFRVADLHVALFGSIASFHTAASDREDEEDL